MANDKLIKFLSENHAALTVVVIATVRERANGVESLVTSARGGAMCHYVVITAGDEQ